jgi:hypothetical protein
MGKAIVFVLQQPSWVDSEPLVTLSTPASLSPGERASVRGFFFTQLRPR